MIEKWLTTAHLIFSIRMVGGKQFFTSGRTQIFLALGHTRQ